MNTLSRILTVVLFCLILASSAAADSIHLSVSPTSTYLNGPAMTYQVSGETEVGRGYAIRLMRVGWEGSNCGHIAQIKSGVYEWHNVREASVEPSPKFEYSGSFSLEPEYDYEGLGTYVVCAATVKSEAPAETSASFTVVSPPPPSCASHSRRCACSSDGDSSGSSGGSKSRLANSRAEASRSARQVQAPEEQAQAREVRTDG
jgi:hypothetical protein